MIEAFTSKRRCDESEPTVTILPPLPALNEGRDLRVAAAPQAGLKQRGKGQRFAPAKRSATGLLRRRASRGAWAERVFQACKARWLKRVSLVFAATAATRTVANTSGSCAA